MPDAIVGESCDPAVIAASLIPLANSCSISRISRRIGIFDDEDPDKNPGVLSRLARATGGEAFFPRERTEVVAICEGIARDIRNQYTIGYGSGNAARTGAWRSIRLTAAAAGHDKLRVRTRSGYIAGDESRGALK